MTNHSFRPQVPLTLGALLIATLGLGVSTTAQSRWNGSGVTVYTNPNFGGQRATFNDDVPNLVPSGLNDKISSIEIPDGETWEVCQDIDYGNQCQVLSESVPDLRSMGWNDRISSLRRIDNGGFRDRRSGRVFEQQYPSRGVTVYVNPNFRGASASFRDDTPNLVPYDLNDKISSIEIPDGEAWEVCQDIDYGNQCQVLSRSVSDLRSIGWSDRISSLRRVGNAGGRARQWGGAIAPGLRQGGLLFFNQPGYRGASKLVTGGSSNMGFSAQQGSIQIRGGGVWELCDNYGDCATIDRNVSDVSELGLSGRITSAHALNASQYRWNRDNDRNR